MARPGTLTLDDTDVIQGTILVFRYTVAAAQVSAKNWVGIYRRGTGPAGGSSSTPSLVWEYAPGTSGSVTLKSGQLRPGEYDVFYLYNDAYTELAEPIALTVRATPLLPPPRYDGSFGRGLASPAGLFAGGNRLWLADARAGLVRQYDVRGWQRSTLGERVLDEPVDVTVGGGKVYVADHGRHRVEVFSLNGRHLTTIGAGQLDRPRGVALHDGQLLVADLGHNRVARFDLRTGRVVGAITTGLHIPHGLAVDGDQVWVVSSSRQFDENPGVTCYVDDEPVITLGYGTHSQYGGLSNPAHVAIGRRGEVLVTVPDLGLVSRFEPTGAFVGQFGGSGGGLLRQPLGIATGPGGRIWVADSGHRRIAHFRGES